MVLAMIALGMKLEQVLAPLASLARLKHWLVVTAPVIGAALGSGSCCEALLLRLLAAALLAAGPAIALATVFLSALRLPAALYLMHVTALASMCRSYRCS